MARSSMTQNAFNQRRLLQRTEDTWHRKGYHRFFEGYTEYRVPEGKKMRTKRVYTSNYYVCELTKNEKIAVRAFFTVLATLAVILFFRAGLRHTAANTYLPITFIQAASLVLLGWFSIALGHYLVSFKKMEVRQYRNAVTGLRDSAYAAAIAMALLGVVTLIYAVAADRDHLIEEFKLVAMILGSACSLAIVGAVERQIPYHTEKSSIRIPPDATDVYCIRG